MTKAGYNVTREYYINDAGKQITNLALSLYSRYLALFDIERPIPKMDIWDRTSLILRRVSRKKKEML